MTPGDQIHLPATGPTLPDVDLPLHGLLVLDFSQYLAGPVAALRLADLGARVIKIERPGVGDSGRQLDFAGQFVDGDAITFHVMNRHKESVTADLKETRDLEGIRRLVRHADVIVQNFRPGVMERIGLDFASVRAINPGIVYASVSGYGAAGPWKGDPGQDLLAQARSGVLWLNGAREGPPVAVGLAIADMMTASNVALGIVSCIARRQRTGQGGLVECSLLESMIDLQFESVGAYLNNHDVQPRRGPENGAHAYLGAPYGVYPTLDGYLALAMYPVPRIGELIGLEALTRYTDPASWLTLRDEIIASLSAHLATRPTQDWLDVLQPADVWCAPVLTLAELVGHPAFAAIDMTQQVLREGTSGPIGLEVTRLPIRFDGKVARNSQGAPALGADNQRIDAEFSTEASPRFT
jgi:CoA:oxalate CoA-transferase